MRQPKATTAPRAVDDSAKKPNVPVKRNRESATFTPRPDLWAWAVPFFKKTRYGNATRFLDAKMLQEARRTKKLRKKLEIQWPNLEAEA